MAIVLDLGEIDRLLLGQLLVLIQCETLSRLLMADLLRTLDVPPLEVAGTSLIQSRESLSISQVIHITILTAVAPLLVGDVFQSLGPGVDEEGAMAFFMGSVAH